MINKNCLYCHKEFRVYPYQEIVGRGKYCSKLCADKSRIGKPSWNAGTGKFLTCKTCGGKFRDKKWRNKLVYCSRKCQLKGEWKTKVVKTLLMKSEDYTPEIREKLSLAKRGKKSHLWRGGISAVAKIERTRAIYRQWRESVFTRDDYSCRICGITGGDLNAHHIKPFNKYPSSRLDVANGLTLCEPCHAAVDSNYRKVKPKFIDKGGDSLWQL